MAQIDASSEFDERLLEWLDGETLVDAQVRFGSADVLFNRFRDVLGNDAEEFSDLLHRAQLRSDLIECAPELQEALGFESGFGEFYADLIGERLLRDAGSSCADWISRVFGGNFGGSSGEDVE